jgi:RimJ/RimL family protein N-acetyltransferase
MASAVVLREVVDADVPIFFEHQRDPAANRMAAFTAKDPHDRAAFDAKWAKNRADPAVTFRTILYEGQVAGYVASFLSSRTNKLEVCYWLGNEFWGRGIATEALAAFLQIVTTRPIYAGVAKDNAASIRVLQKCGFAICQHDRGFANARGEEIEEVLMEFHDAPAKA